MPARLPKAICFKGAVYRRVAAWRAATLPTKNLSGEPRPHFTIVGTPDGTWEIVAGYPLGALRNGGWTCSAALAAKNNWKNLSVEGATEYNQALLKALREAVQQYPELAEYIVVFDGPYIPFRDVVAQRSSKSLGQMEWLHGTSDQYLDSIVAVGLQPREVCKVSPGYGTGFSCPAGRPDAVYLTTQRSTAIFAALQVAKATKGNPIILHIVGLRDNLFIPDEDSKETTAVKSLERLGSVAYRGTIPPGCIAQIEKV